MCNAVTFSSNVADVCLLIHLYLLGYFGSDAQYMYVCTQTIGQMSVTVAKISWSEAVHWYEPIDQFYCKYGYIC
jgi:hypothetical protein